MSTVEKLDEAVRLSGVSAYGARFTDLAVRYGEVVVLTGPNGTGKSTISRLIVGELAASGSVQVLGSGPAAAELKGRIGYLVKDLETMGSLTSRDVLDICAAVRGCGTAYAHELAARLGLEIDRPMGQLCRGQLRRLGIVQALMHEPELIVLDDPMTELDDEARRVLPALLHEAAARGAAVLVTSQSEPDAEGYADRTVQLTRSAVIDDQDNEAPEAASEPQQDLEPARAVVVRAGAMTSYRTPLEGRGVSLESRQKSSSCATVSATKIAMTAIEISRIPIRTGPLHRGTFSVSAPVRCLFIHVSFDRRRAAPARRCTTKVTDRSVGPPAFRTRTRRPRRRSFPAHARLGGVPCRSRRRGGG